MTNERVHIDQMGFPVRLPESPSRIISLVPSQTELLHDLALTDQVVGITKFCIHPGHWKSEKKIIGGTKNFNFERIDALQPDLIIGNKEENYPEGIDRLKEHYPVWMSDVNALGQAFQMISGIGEITNRKSLADTLVHSIHKGFSAFQKLQKPKRILYFIWKKPWMVAGANTFIDDILTRIGFQNAAAGFSRYPIVDENEIASLNPDCIFLSSEPYPFTTDHVKRVERQFPNTNVLMVDGEYFSWYGSRLQYAPRYFQKLIAELS